MKILFTISLIFFLFSNFLFATEINIIELHTSKSLDQLVLENNSDDSSSIDSTEEVFEQEVETEELSESESIVQEELINKTEEELNKEKEILIETNDIIIDENSFWESLDKERLNFYFNNINYINSKPIYNEFVNLLLKFDYNMDKSKNREIFYLLINKLLQLGEIQKSYNLIKSNDVANDENLSFYKMLELNYLFSTYQLIEACELKDELNILQIKLSNYYLEKTDIFCLLMEEKFDEANLLNSILIETEKNNDEYFQKILNVIINPNKEEIKQSLFLQKNYSEDLIFLYSAMLRIAELPLNEKFLNIDPSNLSIPIILSNATPMNLRLRAANKAFLNKLISIESLAALYQSVDFTSDQLNNSLTTISSLSKNNEMIMAYYYQLINVQIFPSSRIKVIIDFWNFAKKIGLEDISYNLTYNIISAIEPSIENSNLGLDIAIALINNKDFDRASKWILYAENSRNLEDELQKVKLLYELYQSDNLDSLFNFVDYNLNLTESIYINEIMNVTSQVLNIDNNLGSNLVFDRVMDERFIPTTFLISEIEKAILSKDESNLFLLILVTLNQKEWHEIHPEHLKLILQALIEYKDSRLLKNVLLDIFKNVEIF